MSEKCKKIIAKYSITTCIAVMTTLFVLSNRGFTEATDSKLKILYLADAFTIPGVVILMVGVMTWLSSSFGLFDGVTYSLGRLKRSLLPFGNNSDERFYDYKQRKMASRKTGYLFLFVVGGVFLVTAIVFSIIHGCM